MIATISSLETLLLFFALLMIVFATVIFLVNSYQVFSQQSEQAANDPSDDIDEPPLWSRQEIVEAYDFAGQQRRERLDDLPERPIDESDLFDFNNHKPTASRNGRVRQQYYPNSAELQAARAQSENSGRPLVPVLGAAILLTAITAVAVGYWRQKN